MSTEESDAVKIERMKLEARGEIVVIVFSAFIVALLFGTITAVSIWGN